MVDKRGKKDGDDGNWHTDAPLRKTVREREYTDIGVTSKAVRAEMEKEDAFLASVPNRAPDEKRFTDRRPHPTRERETP